MRDGCSSEQIEAHQVLDMVASGFDVPKDEISWALFVLGDGVGLVKL
ncbi:hypothetical protein [Polynucleobacter sp. UK-Kesae-W10]|nr:hypothetical protein [Polynucleobacter sp. UK-Kesae-W10]MBU3577518.1 hypothetical protein [Polynucleobacter sp. UK-Kesae-W10]